MFDRHLVLGPGTASSISKYRFMIGEPSRHELYYPRYDPITPRYEPWFVSRFLSVRTVKSIGSYHISIRPYCEIYWFVSQFHQAVLWNLSVHITFQSGRTVKSIGSYHNSNWPYCESYRFVSQLYQAVLWNLSVRIAFRSGHTVKSIGLHHNSIGSYRLFVVFWTVAIGNFQFDCPRNPTTCKDADHHFGKARTGSYHRPTNHRVASYNRPWTDVVGPYCCAAYILLHCTWWIQFVSWSGRIATNRYLLMELAELVY
jgi:hypothetical protein